MEETAKKEQKTGIFKKVKTAFKNLKAEFSKIIWLDKKAFTKQTIAVVLISVCLGAVIAVLDLVLKFGINFII